MWGEENRAGETRQHQLCAWSARSCCGLRRADLALIAITGRAARAATTLRHYRKRHGLRLRRAIFYEGYRIGQVSAIDPERGTVAAASRHDHISTRYKVTLAVRRDWPIRRKRRAADVDGPARRCRDRPSRRASRDYRAPGSELAGTEECRSFTSMIRARAATQRPHRNQIARW